MRNPRHWITVWMLLLTAVLTLAGCSFGTPTANRDADIIVVGDSILAWHRGTGRSIPSVVADQTGLTVSNVAVNGARFIAMPGIAAQYVAGDYDWVIMDGGGNDLLPVCGTENEARVLNALITADGRGGAIAQFANSAAAAGAQVIVLGYYPVSDRGGPFVQCRAALAELAVRQARIADRNPDIIFVDAGRVIGSSDVTAYAPDLVHPSPRGAALVGQLIASAIRANGG